MKKITIMKEGSSWAEAYPILSKVINDKKLMIGAEIGVAYGGHAEYILSHTKVKKLYGIDPYRHIWGYNDPMNFYFWKFNKLCESMLSRLSIFKDRFSLIRKKSEDAINDIHEKLDFVYIDADHSYEGVKNDISRWFVKVKVNGIISGHDYNHPNFPGVKRAVDEFFKTYNWTINYDKSGVWWVEKKQISISFIIPAYNCSSTVKESIFSILETNFEKGDEIVIVDDKSDDSTLEVIKDVALLNSAIKIIENKSNLGGGVTRNVAIQNTSNNLIFCLDSDNILEKDSISKLKNFLISTKSDIASFGGLKFFKDNIKQITHKWEYKEGNVSLSDFFCSAVIPPSSGNYLFTKESWINSGKYPEFAGALDTWGFGFRQVVTNSKMKVLPNTYYFHRYGHDSYWTRESRGGQISLYATKLIEPYSKLINNKTLLYIQNNPNKWFNKLGNLPGYSCNVKGKIILPLKDKLITKIPFFIKNGIKKNYNYLKSNYCTTILVKIKNKLNKNSPGQIQKKRVKPWLEIDGDKTLRLNYPLNSASIVVDVGGFEGQWSSDIFSKYCSNIYIFEPVKEFSDQINKRFLYNKNITCFNVGLSNMNQESEIALLSDGSSMFKTNTEIEKIKLVNASKFFTSHNIDNIDLLKINIEGSEYDLLENLIENNFISRIKNIQVQFHDFVPGAKERMINIQKKLKETHHLTYQYEFVWENWEINI